MNPAKGQDDVILTNYLLNELGDISSSNRDYVANILSWLTVTPRYTIFRVNTMTYSSNDVKDTIFAEISKQSSARGVLCPSLYIHPKLSEIVILESWNLNSIKLVQVLKEVIIDVSCGVAVLRGANIFAPGIKGMLVDTIPGDSVSIFVDIENKCTRGLTCTFQGTKYFVGNGIVKIGRSELFGKNAVVKGVAVEMLHTIGGVPCLPPDCVPESFALLQNLPSVLCCKILNPCEGENVLDMCAAPGNKTTHLAILMNDKGTIVALDKTHAKIQAIKDRCQQFGITSVQCYVFDSTKAVSKPTGDVKITDVGRENTLNVKSEKLRNVESEHKDSLPFTSDLIPPFPCESFDRILLDAPCSALGQRPKLSNKISLNQLKSYPPLQRKLFQSAVALLKPGGHLVYSTCTITVSENENIVKWALSQYPCLDLVPIDSTFGGPGLNVGLSESQQNCVRRFGPPMHSIDAYYKNYDYNQDTVGFFIAHFVKSSL